MDHEEVTGGGSRIAENTLFLALSNGGSLAFTLLQLGILSRFLELGTFGLFVALRGFSLLLATVVLLGLPQVLIRYFPSCQQRFERGRAAGLFILAAVVVFIAGVALYISRSLWIEIIPEKVAAISISGNVLYWVTVASIALAGKKLLYGAFNGLRIMKFQMIFELLYLAVLTFYIVYYREQLSILYLFKAIAVLNGLVFILGAPLLLYQIKKQIPSGGESKVSGIELPPLFPYWLASITISMVALAFTDVDRFVMSSLLPLAAISVFHVASRINNLLKRFLGIPVIAARPEITRVYEEGKWKKISSRIGLFTKLILLVSLSVVGIVAVIGRDIILILSGPEYAGAHRVLLILLPTVPLAAISAPLIAAMRALRHMKWAVLCDFIWMAFYFGTFTGFVSLWGVEGMAVAQLVATVAQLSFSIVIARREGFYGHFGEGVPKFVFCLVPVVAAGIFITGELRIWASVVFLMVIPFILRKMFSGLRVFDWREKRKIVDFVPLAFPRRVVSWFISVGG